VSVHSDYRWRISVASVQVLNPSSVSSLKSFDAKGFKQCIQAMEANIRGCRRMIALANSFITCGERFQFGAAHSEYCLGRFTFAGENGFNCRNGRGAETGSGFGYGHGI
jgi:hypothetical protein